MSKFEVQTKELVELISAKTGEGKGKSKQMLDAVVEVIKESLEQGKNVRLHGLVDFTVAQVEAKERRNPKTNETFIADAHTVRKAKISGSFRKA